MKVSVAGTGYVGLVSGVCLAEKGHHVVCIDTDLSKVETINNGMSPIYEHGLDTLLKRHVGRSLTATDDLRRAVLGTDITLIAVGTPFKGDQIDLSYIEKVARQIGEVLREKNSYHTVVVKSTVVPGTTESVVLPILEQASGKRAGPDFGVGMNPEFLKEGEAVKDFLNPDRIVYGGIDNKSIACQQELYAPFSAVDQIATNCSTAEMIKYMANALLATMISFSNEMANLCSATGGIDIIDVTRGVHLDKRLTPILSDGTRVFPGFTAYIEAGCGFGGSCFPKDLKALAAYGKKTGSSMRILNSVIEVNDEQPAQMLHLLKKHYPDLRGICVAVLGFAFKPGTDDIRESPALAVTRMLLEAGALVRGYDPIAQNEAKKIFSSNEVTFCSDWEMAVSGAHAILIITKWPEFENLPAMIASLPKQPVVIDGRRMIARQSVAIYEGIGL